MTGQLDRLANALAPRYRVLRELGSGGMATVYLAEDLKHGRKVAAKVLRPDLAASLGPERFLREISIAAQLQHPNVLPLHDSGEAAGFLYYVMPFVEGESLRERLAREGALPVPEAVRLLREVVDALAYAHAHGVVHRDIKPENVMLSGRHALVADFGVAKAVNAAGRTDGLTTVGMAVGTPAYMAPEQAAADPGTDHRADLYAAGILAYEMLTGRLPFTATTPQGVLAAQLTMPPPPIDAERPGLPAPLGAAVMRCLAKDPADRWPTADALLAELETLATPAAGSAATLRTPSVQRRGRGRLAWSGGVTVAALAVIGIAHYRAWARETTDLRWVRDSAVPAIRAYADSGLSDSAFLLAMRARARSRAADSLLAPLWPRFTAPQTIRSVPESAAVSWAMYNDSAPGWWGLGTTPLDSVRVTRLSRLRIEKAGYRPLEIALAAYRPNRTDPFVLTPADGPENPMIQFPAESTSIYLPGLDHLPVLPLGAFRIGRTEVTNFEFKRFVDSGGYRRPELWESPIVLGGKSVPWGVAMSRFTDRTGRPGPATWEAGTYPAGQGAHPVAGVSWYEASAYARFAGKALPTVYHWSSAAATPLAYQLVPLSNFSGTGTTPAGHAPALGVYGVRDIAGNVREWCANATGSSRYVLGGGWSDQEYQFTDAYAQEPGDRSPINGVRLAEYAAGDTIPAIAARPVRRAFRDFLRERPVSDAVFASYRRQFEYDRRPLDPVVEAVDSSAEDWIREKVVVDGAYGERLPLYVFLPRGGAPPYQTLVYFPGSNALHDRVAEQALQTRSFDFVLKSGRAVVYPVYKSTYERGDSTESDYSDPTNRYREHVVMWGKDLRRAIDYVESRPDLAADKVGYYGVSWGGALGGIWPAIEPRLKTSVLLVAGLQFTEAQPEVEVSNYLPRIRTPVLMLNGQYDFFFPVETSQVPMFRLLGTPAEHKRQIISEGGHFVPRTQLISETLSWLDRYLGAVR